MAYVLSIIANPATPVIDQAFRNRLHKAFPESEIAELAEGVAYDVYLEDADEDDMMSAVLAREDSPVDINLVPAGHRRKKLPSQ